MNAFGLYIHIPYCDSKCPYCDFNSYAVEHWPEQAYVEALVTEIAQRGAEPAWNGRPLASVFLGGGTPSLFSAASVHMVLERVAQTWRGLEQVEVTLEANPGTVDARKLAGFRAAGVNRMSFGVQSFHDRHLRTLGRIHSAADAERALADARTAGFDNVNLDLMFALPGQHIDECIADIDQAARQGTTHVSAYHLTYEEGTAFHRWRSTKRLVPLDEDAEAEMFDATRQRLAEHGFAAYEISNFARPGFACRHNLVYWRARDYLGVGAGAYSYARAASPPWGRRWCNVRSPAAYLKSMRTRRSAEADAEALDAKQAAGEFVFLHLRTMAGMDQSSFHERFGSRWGDVYPEAHALVGDGLLEDDGSTIRLTPRGVRFADSVFSSFF